MMIDRAGSLSLRPEILLVTNAALPAKQALWFCWDNEDSIVYLLFLFEGHDEFASIHRSGVQDSIQRQEWRMIHLSSPFRVFFVHPDFMTGRGG